MTREEHHAQDRAALLAWRRSHVAGAVPEPKPEHTTARAHPCPFCETFVTRYPSRLSRHVESAHPDAGRED